MADEQQMNVTTRGDMAAWIPSVDGVKKKVAKRKKNKKKSQKKLEAKRQVKARRQVNKRKAKRK